MARTIVAVCLLSTIALPAGAQRSTPPQLPPTTQPSPLRSPDVIFLPSDDAVVDAMLKLAKVHKDDVVYDLGCGDGKIVIAAAKKYGARGGRHRHRPGAHPRSQRQREGGRRDRTA